MKRLTALLLSAILIISAFSGCNKVRNTSGLNSGSGSGSGSKSTTTSTSASNASSAAGTPASSGKDIAGLKYTDSVELKYAKQVTIDNYEGGYRLITTTEGDRVLVVPEGAKAPDGLDKDISVLNLPATKLYLAASSAMALFNAVDAVDSVSLSGITGDWYISKANDNLASGKMKFAGKYSAPDYELMLSDGCQLAIQSTMIYHSPEIKEKLIELGIPVFVDLSAREGNPLGRMEWVKVYGAFTNNMDKADAFFKEKTAAVEQISGQTPTGKTVAFFSINSAGLAVVRKSKDYVPAMIEIAGAKYIFEHLGDDTDALSTMNISLEEFYQTAMNADILIYNSTIEGEINSIKSLTDKAGILADLKAIKSGDVWCTDKNMYQATDSIADVIVDMRAIFANDAEGIKNLKYIKKLN